MTFAPAPTHLDVETVRSRVRDLMPQARTDLEALVRIPSVSAPAFDPEQLQRSAEAVADLLRGAGLPEVQILRAGTGTGTGTDAGTGTGTDAGTGTGTDAGTGTGADAGTGTGTGTGTDAGTGGGGVPGAPAVVARRPAAQGAPTVLLYAHHDVQPPGDPQLWTTPAFEPVERDGRLYGRGSADDKGGIAVHLTAIRALGPDNPLGLTVFVEGEEEVGSPSFGEFLRTHQELLAADVIVIADSGNWRLGLPALTTSLRGLVDGVVEVATLDHAVHSGMFGGAVPDAVTALVRLLNGLWDDAGTLTVPGLVAGEAELDYAEGDLRADAGVLDGVELVGSGTLASRLWTRPSLTITGIDVPPVATASNTLLPAVRAKFSLRLAPGQDPLPAFDALREHLVAAAPWGCRVDVRLGEAGRPWAGDVDGPVYDTARWALREAYGHEAVHMGIGGSIPFIAELGEVYPGATVLVTGVEDPDTRAHGTDESLHLAEFERACVAHALLLAALAAPPAPPAPPAPSPSRP